MAVESFDLTFHLSRAVSLPSPEQLEQEIQNFEFKTLRLELTPETFAAWSDKDPEADTLYYFLLGATEETYVNVIGDADASLRLILALLHDRSRNASLQVHDRPVLTQVDGQLRLDLERFWNERLL